VQLQTAHALRVSHARLAQRVLQACSQVLPDVYAVRGKPHERQVGLCTQGVRRSACAGDLSGLVSIRQHCHCARSRAALLHAIASCALAVRLPSR
jgi:hypothetical protein